MALKAIPISQVVPHIDEIHVENVSFPSIYNNNSTSLSHDEDEDDDVGKMNNNNNKFVVMGHRGSGTNMLQYSSCHENIIKENTLRSFNEATKFNLQFIEFDVQGKLIEKRVTDLTLEEFLSYGPQNGSTNVEKPLFRKTKDGRIFEWKVEEDDRLCTLQYVFENVSQSVGFNIEFKFDDKRNYKDEELVRVIQAALQVVLRYAKGKRIMFSSFQPDAAQLIRKEQTAYPVFFLTNGGSEIYPDIRRNSLEEAIKLCLEGGLQGIVSEVKAILRNPKMIANIKESNLSLMTYGQLNNEKEVVYLLYMMGVDGVIVDFVEEITSVVAQFSNQVHHDRKEHLLLLEKRLLSEQRITLCSEDEISYFRRLVPELIHL
nr:glycerophosphodiester phosphodiesterase GDPD3-like isoform X2 [Solanum lycopersicum]